MAKEVTQEQLGKLVPAVADEFKAALENAETIYAKDNASQEEVNNAFDRLAKVMQMLEFYKGDKIALQEMMDKIANLTANDYTESTWNALQAVLPGVNEVLGNVNAMQGEVDEVYTELVKAFLNLRLKPNKDLLEDLINKANGLNRASYTAASLKVVDEEAAKANASTRANGKEITVIGVNGSDSSKTAAASKKLDEVAPEIIGLEYQSETKAEHAKYFKIYHYDQGITLLEIDMSKKTGRKAAGKKWKQSSDTSGLNPAEQEQAALYLNKVVKYLIVPENAEIPAGLDKEVIVVRQPADHIYAGTNKIISKIAKLGQTDKVTAVGVKKKKCKNETIKEKMEKKEIIYTGKSGKLNYKKLVKNKCDLALLSSGILPKKGSSKKAARKKMKAYQKMTEKMTLLEMPVIVDRSKDEKGKDAKKEWEKVYQVILGCEDQSAE